MSADRSVGPESIGSYVRRRAYLTCAFRFVYKTTYGKYKNVRHRSQQSKLVQQVEWNDCAQWAQLKISSGFRFFFSDAVECLIRRCFSLGQFVRFYDFVCDFGSARACGRDTKSLWFSLIEILFALELTNLIAHYFFLGATRASRLRQIKDLSLCLEAEPNRQRKTLPPTDEEKKWIVADVAAAVDSVNCLRPKKNQNQCNATKIQNEFSIPTSLRWFSSGLFDLNRTQAARARARETVFHVFILLSSYLDIWMNEIVLRVPASVLHRQCGGDAESYELIQWIKCIIEDNKKKRSCETVRIPTNLTRTSP